MSGIPLPLREALSGQYRVERELGRGGMASVYLARDLKHQRPVALKVMREEIAVSLGADRFLREIEIAARLQHPHILPLFDSGEAGGLLYYVMPYVEGETLRGRLQRERQLPVEDACAIARQIAGALAYAHSQGVIHRDIKPENILLSAGVAVVADFGIAKALSAASAEPGETSTGLAIGTPLYMSPEQASGETVDGRSDLYALGCLLYEMLAGAPPFTGPSVQAIIAGHMTESPPSLRVVRPAVVPALQRVVERALAKSPADRFTTVWQFGEAIGHASAALASVGTGLAEAPTAALLGEGGAVVTPNLGPVVHQTCNRWQQVNAFDAFFRECRRSRPGKPMVVVIHGEDGEGHESLIERLLATRVAHLAEQLGGRERGVVPRIRTHWPVGDSLEVRQRDLPIGLFGAADPRYLGDDLSAAALGGCRPVALAPIVVVQHDLQAEQWDDATGRLLRWYLRVYWNSYPTGGTAPQVLIFLKLVYPAADRVPRWRQWLGRAGPDKARIQKQLATLLSEGSSCPSLVLAELAPVTLEDVTDWFNRNRIFPSEQKRRAAAEALFRQRRARRLSEIEHALEGIHRQFIQEHLLERGNLP